MQSQSSHSRGAVRPLVSALSRLVCRLSTHTNGFHKVWYVHPPRDTAHVSPDKRPRVCGHCPSLKGWDSVDPTSSHLDQDREEGPNCRELPNHRGRLRYHASQAGNSVDNPPRCKTQPPTSTARWTRSRPVLKGPMTSRATSGRKLGGMLRQSQGHPAFRTTTPQEGNCNTNSTASPRFALRRKRTNGWPRVGGPKKTEQASQ
ncbi:hypothetical protein VTI74DRAFT_4609 [Chaetomium olivicolor]